MLLKNNMTIKEELLADIRVFKAPDLAKHILATSQLNELVTLGLEKDHLLSSRAMWVLSHCSDIDSNCVKPYYSKLILNLKHKNLPDGVIRSTLRLFQDNEVPSKHQALVLDTCYTYIKNPLKAIAIRSFAITVVYQLSKPYPELLNELKMVLLHVSTHPDSPGMNSKIKNTLKLIDKYNRK